jgi:hypothetical protein
VLEGDYHGFGAAGGLELGEDVADVKFDGGTADDQSAGDLVVV